jgi:hypothetical protein
MNWSIIVTVCHLVTVGTAQVPACHQEIAAQHRARTEACNLAQSGLAQWKANGKFADDEFYLGGWRCVPDGEAFIKDQT